MNTVFRPHTLTTTRPTRWQRERIARINVLVEKLARFAELSPKLAGDLYHRSELSSLPRLIDYLDMPDSGHSSKAYATRVIEIYEAELAALIPLETPDAHR